MQLRKTNRHVLLITKPKVFDIFYLVHDSKMLTLKNNPLSYHSNNLIWMNHLPNLKIRKIFENLSDKCRTINSACILAKYFLSCFKILCSYNTSYSTKPKAIMIINHIRIIECFDFVKIGCGLCFWAADPLINRF